MAKKKDVDDTFLDGAEALGLQLVKLRKAAALTQEEVSVRMGYSSERNVSDYEGGRRVIKLWELINFYEQCGVEPQETLAEMLAKRPHGLQYKPAERVPKRNFNGIEKPDYIESFQKLVKQSPNPIPDLKVLLTKPHRFTSIEYYRLLANLNACPETFSLENLRDAYGRLRADLISIVQHAATGNPILDQDERIAKATELLQGVFFDSYGRDKPKPVTNGGPPLNIVAEKSSMPREERQRVFNRLVQFLHVNVLISDKDLATPFFSKVGIKPEDVKNAFGPEVVTVVNRTVIQVK